MPEPEDPNAEEANAQAAEAINEALDTVKGLAYDAGYRAGHDAGQQEAADAIEPLNSCISAITNALSTLTSVEGYADEGGPIARKNATRECHRTLAYLARKMRFVWGWKPPEDPTLEVD